MTNLELVKIPGIRKETAFKILAGGVESLHPKTQLKLLAERMRHQMREASKLDTQSGVTDFASYRKSRSTESRRNGTSQMTPPSGQDNYGAYEPRARREML